MSVCVVIYPLYSRIRSSIVNSVNSVCLNMSDISAEERKLIKAIRKEVKSELCPKYDKDYNILRWIRAYDGNRDLVMSKLKRHLKLRTILDLDNIRENETEDVDPISPIYAPVSIFGRNSKVDNKLVVFEFPGKCDVFGMRRAIQLTPFMLGRFRLMETIMEHINELERLSGYMSGVVFVYDLQGLDVLDPLLITVITGQLRILWGALFENYPEWIHRMILVNVPSFINILWKAFIPFVPDQTKTKIVFTSKHWKSELLDYIDADHLPVQFGGSLIDENGKIFVPPPGKIPRSQYWSSAEGEPRIQDLSTLTVAAGAKSVMAYNIIEPNTIIEFFLYSESDYTFGIYRSSATMSKLPPIHQQIQGCPPKLKEVFLNNERPGMLTIDQFKFVCKEEGKYLIKFGNEKSWFLPVHIKYELRFVNGWGKRIFPKSHCKVDKK